nr:MAG TPA: DNA repair protein MmcB-like protein [Caudoviricetes sp.]
MLKDIIKYERAMVDIINYDKSSWAKFYLLMKEIEEKELYKEANKNSFTAWVKDFCLKNKIHESVIWNRKKAGKVYESYARIQKEKGIEVPPIEETNVSMDSLVLVDKITKKAPKLGAELTAKAINKEITRDDLRTAYKTIRGDLVKAKQDIQENAEEATEGLEMANNEEIKEVPKVEIKVEEVVTASKIIQAFNNPCWLGVKEIKRKAFKPSHEQDKYKTLTEFAVYTGTSKHSRRIDLLAVENITVENHFEMNLHGIEIKVSKSDLINDSKYTEYGEFVNYLWIAIPKKLEADARATVPDDVGIMVYGRGKMKVVKEANRLKPLQLENSLTTLALKLL